MSSVTLRIAQRGYTRALGYQVTQWAVTEPISYPPEDPPLATDPLTYAGLFVVRVVGQTERLERVATLEDFENYELQYLKYFDLRGTNGSAVLESALVGDVLRITSDKPYWIQDDAPYTDQDFTVAQVAVRAQGSAPLCITGSQVQLTGYVFTDRDLGRWFKLSGFSTSGNNGWVQVLSHTGSTAVVNRDFVSSQTGTDWVGYWIEIDSTEVGLEPRFFPTREVGLSWALYRSDMLIADGNGGATMRADDAEESYLVRAHRFTSVVATVATADALLLTTRKGVEALQRAAEQTDAEFSYLVSTYGP